jgi:hypothetical protein
MSLRSSSSPDGSDKFLRSNQILPPLEMLIANCKEIANANMVFSIFVVKITLIIKYVFSNWICVNFLTCFKYFEISFNFNLFSF